MDAPRLFREALAHVFCFANKLAHPLDDFRLDSRELRALCHGCTCGGFWQRVAGLWRAWRNSRRIGLFAAPMTDIQARGRRLAADVGGATNGARQQPGGLLRLVGFRRREPALENVAMFALKIEYFQ